MNVEGTSSVGGSGSLVAGGESSQPGAVPPDLALVALSSRDADAQIRSQRVQARDAVELQADARQARQEALRARARHQEDAGFWEDVIDGASVVAAVAVTAGGSIAGTVGAGAVGTVLYADTRREQHRLDGQACDARADFAGVQVDLAAEEGAEARETASAIADLERRVVSLWVEHEEARRAAASTAARV